MFSREDLVAVFILLNCVSPIVSFDKVRRGELKLYNIFKYSTETYAHAESPVWDCDTNTLYWVDVLNHNVHALQYTATGKIHRMKHIGYGEVNVVVPIRNSSRVLVGVRSEVFLLDWSLPGDSALKLVAGLDHGKPDNILNEGKADALGRFWGGTKGPQVGDKVTPHMGALYSLESPHFTPHIQIKPVSISNGLVWSLNNTVFYYIDSDTKKIVAFDFDLTKGQLSNRRTIINISDYNSGQAIPDGMTIDIDGFLWVALMFDGSIIRIDPDRRFIVERYTLPVSHITSVAWAGPRLDRLVVTTSQRNMDSDELHKEPLAGRIFMLHCLGTSGVSDHKIVFPNADEY